MKRVSKGFTLVELLIVVFVLAILATLSVPMFGGIIKKSELKGVKSALELVRAGAKYYDIKYGLLCLTADNGAWDYLKVNDPSGPDLEYSIEDRGGAKLFVAKYKGSELYTYNLETETGTKAAEADAAYLPNDSDLYVP